MTGITAEIIVYQVGKLDTIIGCHVTVQQPSSFYPSESPHEASPASSPYCYLAQTPFQLTHSDSRWRVWMVRTGSCPVQVRLLTSLSVFTPLLHCSGWLITGQEWCWSVGQGLASAVDGWGLKDPKIQVTQAVKKAREGVEPPSTESESVVLTATPTSPWALYQIICPFMRRF